MLKKMNKIFLKSHSKRKAATSSKVIEQLFVQKKKGLLPVKPKLDKQRREFFRLEELLMVLRSVRGATRHSALQELGLIWFI